MSGEHAALLNLKWLHSRKVFSEPIKLAIIHISLLDNPGGFDVRVPLQFIVSNVTISPEMRSRPPLPLRGLEKICLDFCALEYMAFFKFDTQEFVNEWGNRYDSADAYMYGGATFLQHTRELTLRFGDRYKRCEPWTRETLLPNSVADQSTPGIHTTVCNKGLLVDWILTFAWYYKFLQHIPVIKLEGYVHDSVHEKWAAVFEGRHRYQDSIGSQKEIDCILDLEEAQEDAPGGWEFSGHYPPACTCGKFGEKGAERWDNPEYGNTPEAFDDSEEPDWYSEHNWSTSWG